MFDNLVDLYAEVFMTQWHHYSKIMDCFPQTGVPPHIYAARCYISMWFIYLYVSNREAVNELSTTAFIERYQGEMSQISHEYDDYLTLLNASIRPTHIKHAIDNAQYIPIISDCIDANNPNPFGIDNFVSERNIFYGLTEIMKKRNLWHFSTLSNDANGRPCWLFDWHSKDNACSWFPDKDNFDMEDVALAYILGTACTPNQGACDVDDWQCFADGIVPHDPNPKRYDRVEERHFYGSYEVRTTEINTEFSLESNFGQIDPTLATYFAEIGKIPTKKLRKNDPEIAMHTTLGEEAQEPMPQWEWELIDQTIPQFRLIDWVYYSRVILKMDNNERIDSLRLMSLA